MGGKDSDLGLDMLSLGGLLGIQVEMGRVQLVYRPGFRVEVQGWTCTSGSLQHTHGM